MAIGARSQSARTYLEKNLDKFVDSNQDELIKHCMRALRDTLPNEVELTVKVNKNSIVFTLENKKISLELCCCCCWKRYAICFIR
jgi:20S proteasome alpha/beta subunit